MAKTKKAKISKDNIEGTNKDPKKSKNIQENKEDLNKLITKELITEIVNVKKPKTKVKNAESANGSPGKIKKKKVKKGKQASNAGTLESERPTKDQTTNAEGNTDNKQKAAVPVKSTEGLSPQDLAKIEKKKAKKLRQKLKKKQRKAAGVEQSKATTAAKVDKSEIVEKAGSSNDKTGKKKNKGLEHPAGPPNPALKAATVFVGNLPTNTKRIQLIKLFSDYGPVNSIRFRTADGRTMFKHKTRKQASSLNAYIVLKDAETAKRSLQLNGTEFKGNHLRVTSSESKPGEENAKRTVFVGNLKYSATEEKLRDIFSSCGEIEYVRCIRDGEKGCKGVAYVCFKSPDAVGLACELNETILDERAIHVERYSVKKLGAKEARDKSAAKEKRDSKKVGKKHLTGKLKKAKQLPPQVKSDDDGKKKKSEFRGVKVDAIKKQKKKKLPNQLQQLVKKIAPKPNQDS